MFLENMLQSFLTKNSYYLAKNSKKQPKMTKNSLKTSKSSEKSKANYFLFLAILLTYTVFYSQNNSEKMSPKKIVLMGNSITEHWQTYTPLFFKENSFFINKGISGQTTVEMLSRFNEDVINQNPQAVYILAGINDIAQNSGYISIDDISTNIIKMGLLAQKNNIKVIICSVMPVTEIAWNEKIKNANQKVIELNQKLINKSKKNNFIYLDYYIKMKDELNSLTYDGLHPNEKGYIKMNAIIKKSLKGITNNFN
jgi:lysophospholipase L1-like esterase